MTLLGFVRQQRFNVYAHDDRLRTSRLAGMEGPN
jgi:hypothetical protein